MDESLIKELHILQFFLEKHDFATTIAMNDYLGKNGIHASEHEFQDILNEGYLDTTRLNGRVIHKINEIGVSRLDKLQRQYKSERLLRNESSLPVETPANKSSPIKVAKIGLIGTIGAAIIAGIVALINNSEKDKERTKPDISIHNVDGDVVNGNKIVDEKIDNVSVNEPVDLSDGNIKIENISEFGGLNLKGYNVYQSLKLNKISNGMNGALLILMDKRLNGIKGDLKYDGYVEALIPDFQSDEKSYDDGDKKDYKPAMMVVVDEKLKIIYYENLGRESARLDRVFIYSDKRKATYILTRDYSIGWGSYNGPTSYFLEVNEKGINYILNKGGYLTSLKSQWIIYLVGSGSEILYKYCRPDSVNINSEKVDFYTTYERCYFEGDTWKLKSAKIKEFWESEYSKVFDIDSFIKIVNHE